MATLSILLKPFLPIPLRYLRPLLLKENQMENEQHGWARLRSSLELGRYGIIHDFCQYLAPGGAVLDVGCGDGVLQERLIYSSYTGLDAFEANVLRASSRADARTRFVHGDAATHVPNETYDAIIWNESLYYMEHPVAALERYRAFLKPGGVMIVSMYYQTFATRLLFRQLEKIGGKLADVRLCHPSGESWVIRAYDASRPEAPAVLGKGRELADSASRAEAGDARCRPYS